MGHRVCDSYGDFQAFVRVHLEAKGHLYLYRYDGPEHDYSR